ncbi:MAG: glycosyltransferase family 2 protein [Agriterribacter sp.]
MQKKISIFIPCYNSANTVSATINSVLKAIDYTKRNIHVTIYDDCSTDDSTLIIESHIAKDNRIKLFKNKKNSGERETTNIAFAKLREQFDWCFIIHADDIVKEDWLSCSIEQIEQIDDEEFFTVWSSYDTFENDLAILSRGDNSGNIQKIDRSYEHKIGYLTKLYSAWHISGSAFNLLLFEKIGGFDTRLAQFGDTDFFVRGLLKMYKDVYVCKTLTLYRVANNSSVTGISIKTNRDITEINLLIEKFNQSLSKADIKKLKGIIAKLSFRRAIKSILVFQPKTFTINCKIFFRTIAN